MNHDHDEEPTQGPSPITHPPEHDPWDEPKLDPDDCDDPLREPSLARIRRKPVIIALVVVSVLAVGNLAQHIDARQIAMV